ncbi:fibronectin type III domain-containing protein [Streptomyces ziwulingensis]|uniref:Cellulose 1,4-beta-cellobiosidase n=1 Tax=Streptomyces ziwulingensis TaxID=1045501 RepID=A0ABP9BKA3_9ACTN
MNPARRTTTAAAATAVVLATAGGLLTAATTSAAAATTCASPVFTRQFFANTAFSGKPKKTDCDSVIDQNWGTKAPASGLPSDNFGVRWSVTRDFGGGGPFTFSAAAQDGIRVYLDGTRKVDVWKNVSSTKKKTVDVTVPKGKHTLRIDFVNWTGAADVKFSYSPRTSATVDKVEPLTPAGAAVTYDKATAKATLTWTKNKEMDLAGYRVYRRLKGAAYPAEPLAKTTSTTYKDSALPRSGETYYYEVRAYDKAGGESAGTADKAVTTVRDATAPAAPKGVEDNWEIGHSTEAKLWWDGNTESDLAGYRVYRSTGPTVPTTADHLVATPANSYYAEPLPQTGDDYRYVVTAVDIYGNESAASQPAFFSTLDETPPTWTPRGLTVVDSEHSITVTWSPMADSDEGEFQLYRDDAIMATTRGTSFTDDWGLKPGDTHTYWLRSIDSAGNPGPSSEKVTVRHEGDVVAPAAVTGLTATARDNGVFLDWDDSTAEDFDHYRVVFQDVDDPGQWYGSDEPRTSELTHHTLPDGARLRYVVIAVDDDGNALAQDDPAAATVEVTEHNVVPPHENVPTDHAIQAFDVEAYDSAAGTMTLHWNYTPEYDHRGAAASFRVERWNAAAGTWTAVTVVARDKEDSAYYFATDPQAPAASTVFYRVAPVYPDGSTAPTDDVVQHYT